MITFQLDEEQWDKVSKWMDKIDRKDEGDSAIGGAFTYTFTPTSIGIAVKVYYLKDTPKEQMLDVSGYESW